MTSTACLADIDQPHRTPVQRLADQLTAEGYHARIGDGTAIVVFDTIAGTQAAGGYLRVDPLASRGRWLVSLRIVRTAGGQAIGSSTPAEAICDSGLAVAEAIAYLSDLADDFTA